MGTRLRWVHLLALTTYARGLCQNVILRTLALTVDLGVHRRPEI